MPWRRCVSLICLVGCCVLAGSSTGFGQDLRQGGEFQVNARTTGSQSLPAIAVEADGDFTVTWSDYDGYGSGIFAHRFDSAGMRQGLQFQVNTLTARAQHRSAVASESNGDFVVVWESFHQDGAGTTGFYGVFGQRFTSAGTRLATEFQVNIFTPNDQENPRVASDSDGDFVVVWRSRNQDSVNGYGVFGRHFDSLGTALAVEFQVSTRTLDNQVRPDVAVDADGDFVVVWESNQQEAPGSSYGVFGKRFNSAGVPQAAEFQINTYTVGPQSNPAVATRADGDFLVAWNSLNQESPGNATGDNGIFARRFSAAGVPQAAEFRVNHYSLASQRYPRIASDNDGDFVVTWESRYQDGDEKGVFARRVGGNGVFGPEFQANAYTIDGQDSPVVDFDADGDFVIAWYSEEAQDGNSYGVFAQRFKLPPLATLDIDANGVVDPLTDGILNLRHRFAFTGAALTTGATAMNCTRCTPGDIQAYLNGLGMTLDIADNGILDPLSDGVLVLRFMFGFTGTTLTNGAVGACNTRCDATAIRTYLQTLD